MSRLEMTMPMYRNGTSTEAMVRENNERGVAGRRVFALDGQTAICPCLYRIPARHRSRPVSADSQAHIPT